MIKNVILDTKPLVLLIIGSIDRKYIKKFIKTKEFSEEEYDLLVDMVGRYNEIIITPHIITELSHLTIEENTFRDDYKKMVRGFLSQLKSNRIKESNIGIQQIVLNDKIFYLGVADISLMELCNNESVVITSDGKLADKLREENKSALKFIPTLGFVNY